MNNETTEDKPLPIHTPQNNFLFPKKEHLLKKCTSKIVINLFHVVQHQHLCLCVVV